VVNAAVTINVFIFRDKLKKEIPVPVEVFGLAEEVVVVWV
jgi:hypothetical protein